MALVVKVVGYTQNTCNFVIDFSFCLQRKWDIHKTHVIFNGFFFLFAKELIKEATALLYVLKPKLLEHGFPQTKVIYIFIIELLVKLFNF